MQVKIGNIYLDILGGLFFRSPFNFLTKDKQLLPTRNPHKTKIQRERNNRTYQLHKSVTM
jgi:hypothetical protein